MKKSYVIVISLVFIFGLVLASLSTTSFSQPTSDVVTLSFDDGWIDNYYNAWVEMEQRGMRGCFNIVTSMPEYYEQYPEDNPSRLTWELIMT